MDLLLVEDDDFKATDIGKVILELWRDCELTKVTSVTAALRILSEREFHLIVLDMSLPTFNMSGPGGGGSPEGQGGIEVLRLAKRLGQRPSVIIVTQYPDIEIDGRALSLVDAPKVLSQRFDLSIRACIPYEFDSNTWRRELRSALASTRVGDN